jgi:hypothetical protein
MATVAFPMDFAYLYGQAALELSEAFWKRLFQYLKGSPGDLGFHVIAPARQNLDVQCYKCPCRISVTYEALFVPDSPALDVVQDKQACRHDSVVDVCEKVRQFRMIDDVCRILQYAMWHVCSPVASGVRS